MPDSALRSIASALDEQIHEITAATQPIDLGLFHVDFQHCRDTQLLASPREYGVFCVYSLQCRCMSVMARVVPAAAEAELTSLVNKLNDCVRHLEIEPSNVNECVTFLAYLNDAENATREVFESLIHFHFFFFFLIRNLI